MSNIYYIKEKADNNLTDASHDQRKQLVLEGVDYILSLFVAVGQQRLFPRKIMTKYTKGQLTVYCKEQIIYSFERANYQDCRINAYPAFMSKAEEQDYKKGINVNLFSPNILFIDLDTEYFKSKEELDRWLNRILKNIAGVLHGVKALVIWSGHGYHIVIPVNAKEALEQFEDFDSYTNEPSKEFLQFAAKYLSLNKSDSGNTPAFKSCLLRVPYTFNSKCLEAQEVSPEVRVIHHWDNSQPLSNIDNLLIEFQTFLVDRKWKADISKQKQTCRQDINNSSTKTIPYVEKLLQMRIEDHRKFSVSLILAPYFVNIQNLSDLDSFSRIKQWVLKCNEFTKLEPSIEYFDDLIKGSIQRAKETKVKPLKFEETLRYKNTELYKILQ